MNSVTYILASHGKFAEELLHSAEMIVGKTEQVYTLSLLPETTFEEFLAEAKSILEKTDGPVIALADLFGGTPANVLTNLTRSYDLEVVTGLSLPMFIELYLEAQQDILKDVSLYVERALTVAKEATVHTNEALK